MPIARRSRLSAEPRRTLVAALSGRALAAAARRAGERALVLDLFADEDTARCAERCIKLPAAGPGFERQALLAAVDELAPAARGLVYGAGFEHDPPLLAALGRRVKLLGNTPETVAAVKDPLRLARLLARLGLPHPETVGAPPPAGATGWLRKLAGGAGGSHVAVAAGAAATPGSYFQRRVHGRPLSALLVADGRAARVLGFSEQWVAPAAGAPFRYGGCAGPVMPPPRLAGAIAEGCNALAAATGLIGLNSLDLLVEEEHFCILEINPRPGATLDLFDGRAGLSLWRLHLEAMHGRLPPPQAASAPVRAAAVLYAPSAIAVPRDMIWPRWTADRETPGRSVPRDAPVCTVRAAAPSVVAARAQLERRCEQLLARLLAGAAARA
jgi:uncharacterized protein